MPSYKFQREAAAGLVAHFLKPNTALRISLADAFVGAIGANTRDQHLQALQSRVLASTKHVMFDRQYTDPVRKLYQLVRDVHFTNGKVEVNLGTAGDIVNAVGHGHTHDPVAQALLALVSTTAPDGQQPGH